MSIPILATKLYIPPPRPKVVLRPRLTEQLSEGLHRKLTLISAPAGFGKTSLVTEWIAIAKQPAAWLSLDEGDNDLTGFLTYLITAVQKVAAHPGNEVLAVLQSPQIPPTESILTLWLNEVAEVPEPFTLVLDDYHVIDSNQIDQALLFLLEHLPPQMHLVLTTREDPQLPLARFRAKDQMTELRAADLRFSPSEAALFLKTKMGLNLSEADILALEGRTEGWIAGLQLAALSMQGSKDITGFIKSFTGNHHFVMDYLVEEVLHQQPEHIQTFLLRTSILERLCGPLCDALLPGSLVSGQDTLEQIENANLFVIPLDNERRWYRYHHLFAELLRERLQHNGAPSTADEVTPSTLHLRASEWFQKTGSISQAVHHGALAQDWSRVADLAELGWPEMDQSFQVEPWLAWVKGIPKELFATRPVLAVAYASAILDTGETEGVEARLQEVEQMLESLAVARAQGNLRSCSIKVVDEEQFKSLPAQIAFTRAYLAQWVGESADTEKYVRRVLELLPEKDYLMRGKANALLALSIWRGGDLLATTQSFADCIACFKQAGDTQSEVSGNVGVTLALVAQGRLEEAKKVYGRFIGQIEGKQVAQIVNSASMHLGLSEIYLEQNRLEEAKQHLNSARECGEQTYIYRWQHLLSLLKIRIAEAEGDLSSALAFMKEAEHSFIPTPVPILRPLGAWKTRLWLKQGSLSSAEGWAQERGFSVDDEASYPSEFDHITYIRVLFAQAKLGGAEPVLPGAMKLLGSLLKAAVAGHRIGSRIEILVLQALGHQALGKGSAALSSLESALAVAEPEGYVQVFLNEGAPLAELLTDVVAQGGQSEFVCGLLAQFSPYKPQEKNKTHAPAVASSQPLVEPLSQRELEVLQCISQGLSNQEISERLFLALSTVKGHNQNIFGKLQVQRRTEAIVRARELGLF